MKLHRNPQGFLRNLLLSLPGLITKIVSNPITPRFLKNQSRLHSKLRTSICIRTCSTQSRDLRDVTRIPDFFERQLKEEKKKRKLIFLFLITRRACFFNGECSKMFQGYASFSLFFFPCFSIYSR